MNRIIKKLSLLLITIIFTFSNITNVFASSASISVSSSSSKVVVGNTFTVTFTVKSSSYMGTWEFTPSYNKNMFKLTSGSSSVLGYGKTKSQSYTYKFKAISSGSGTITVKSAAVRDYDTTKEMSLSKGSKTITVITASQLKATYSKNNYLKSLSVDGLKLSPTFSKTTTSYTAEASSNTTKVNIKATLDDSKSSISGTGTKNVEEGENKFNIVVTAQNGDKKTYTITINVIDSNPIEVTIGENKYTVVKREKNIKSVEGFVKQEIELSNQKVPCLYNETNDFTLIALKDKDSNIEMYIYNKETNEYTKYTSSKLNQMNIFPLELEETYKKDQERTKITIDNVEFDAIKLSAKGLYIVKARDLSNASDNYYEYDEKTNTLIRYVEEDDKKDEEIVKLKKTIILLSTETVIIIIVLIGILIKKMRKNKRDKIKLEEEKKKIEKKKSNKKKEVSKNDKEEENS